MPAAAVIPAPIAYINVVAVKKLVVGFRMGAVGRVRKGSQPCCLRFFFGIFSGVSGIKLSEALGPSFTVNKLECSKQGVS